jgi:hypothetical protein
MTALWAAPLPVCAQQPVDRGTQPSQPGGRAYQGLFGQQPITAQGEALTFVGSLSGGYDENVFAGSGTSGSATRQEEGWIGVATGQLVYQQNTSRRRLEAGAVGGVQYSPTFEDDFARNGSIFANLSQDLTTRWSLGLSGRVGYRDRLRFAQVPDGGGGLAPLPPGGVDDDLEGEGSIAERPSVIYSGGGNVSYRVSPRGTFTALAHASHVDYLDDDQQQDIWSAGARYRYRVTSYFSADAGYGYREGNYARGAAGDQVSRSHSILAGGDYSRPLSPSRRTYLTLGIGSAIYSRDRAAADQGNLYRLIGNARLTHEFGQSWQFTAGYRRGVQWLFYSPEPVFVDNVDLTLSGYFSPQWSLSVLSFYSNGQLAATAQARPLDRFGNTVRLQYAMTRSLAAFAQYIYYYYLTDPITAAQLGIAPEYDRNGFRIGLTTFVPLMR